LPYWAICRSPRFAHRSKFAYLQAGGNYTKFQAKVNEKVAVTSGSHNEETDSKYAEGIRKNKCPSSRQHKRTAILIEIFILHVALCLLCDFY
jgi:hypothetical protein